MSNIEQALRNAIKALETSWTICCDEDYLDGFIDAANQCKSALAEIENVEPVAWTDSQFGSMITNNRKKEIVENYRNYKCSFTVPLYTSPKQREWVGFSDIAWMNIVNHDHAYENMDKEEAVHYAVKATEAKLKQLNTKG